MGDTVTYTFTIENTGNVELANVTLNDDMLGIVNLDLGTLGPSASAIVEVPYVIPEGTDLGLLENGGTVTTKEGPQYIATATVTVTEAEEPEEEVTPLPTTPTAPIAPNYVQQTVGAGTVTVDASSVAGAYATVTGSGGQTVTIEGISSAAASAGGFSIEGATTYVDLHLDNSEGVEQIQFTILGGAGVPMWWNGSSWIECSNYAIDAAGNVTVTITGSTIPSLSDLTGTVFTVVGKPAITVLGITETIPVEIETVRTNPLTCWQIYVNEEGNFEFIFWWEYANNNWVSIYDTQGNLVYLEDFPYGNPVVEVDLTSGMYTVKKFHEAGKILQEFAIGKP
ncbi:MAG: T9SS type A sorting domain-containing protein [Actinobacteria bacterium]|nr:T9SS type A sorting domain-containing protein [Actinomycetota bacterium]